MKRALKVGSMIVAGLLLVSLVTLRVTGLEPRYIDPRTPAFAENNRTAGPGFWLTGEVVEEAVTNWDFINEVNDPVRGNSIMLETRTWYGIPHSVTVNARPRGVDLYLSGSAQGDRLDEGFPNNKAWWANIERDPRVRIKIGDKIYEATATLVQDQDEAAQLLGGNPITTRVDENGNEQVVGVRYYWRVFQRNIPTYGAGAI
ncbi:MAG: DUF385 domain-containing protein [Pseudomonadales bacterium]|nr:DUF385 domain-containing protein [Pseudomonadales bacterium]